MARGGNAGEREGPSRGVARTERNIGRYDTGITSMVLCAFPIAGNGKVFAAAAM